MTVTSCEHKRCVVTFVISLTKDSFRRRCQKAVGHL
jgi:hypothetical protein